MEYFDFNAPVSAVIIYDDESDEDVNPIKQEYAQKDETVSSVSKSQEGTNKHYVGLDTLRPDTPQKNEDRTAKNELKSDNAICTQTNIANESVPTNWLQKLLDMPSFKDVNMKSENMNIKDDSGDKIVNEIKTKINKNEAYVKLVDIEKRKKRKIMDTTEIPDPRVHQPEFSKSKNIRQRNVSDYYKGFGKIIDSEKKNRYNDESQEFAQNIEIFQKTLPDDTSIYPNTSDASHIKITAGINMNTNCILAFNCENEADEEILLSENHAYDHDPRKENENPQKQHCNELATNFNDISDISSNVNVGINRTKSVSNTKYTTNKEINPLPTEKNTNQTQNTCCPKHHETFNCVRNLLDTVSKHLMFIMDSYQCMIKVYTNNADLKVKEMAHNNFVKIKNHFFDLSYSSVVNLILPRKDDPIFTKKFIYNTMAIASSKSLNFSYEHIEMLYIDMIECVQNRQNQIKNTISNNVTLINLLQSPDGQERRKQRPSSCSMQTNHANKIAHQVSCTQPGHFQPQTQNSVAYRKPPPPYPNHTMQARSMHHGHYIPTQSTRYQPSTLQFYAGGVGAQPVYNDNTYMMQHMQTTLNSSSLFNGDSINQQSVSLNSTASRPVQYDAAILKQNQSSSSLNSVHYTTINIQDIRSNHLETNPSYVSPPVQPDNSMQTDCSRSSISRDSGFMSPLNFQYNKTLVPEENRSITPTPLITHVTSLNPKATLSADGLCKVCGKITKQKCIGCYNVYYCCHMCQHFDWSSHQVSCRQYEQTLTF